jgi:excisionase family DNA binding protein
MTIGKYFEALKTPQLLTNEQAASYLGVAPNSLAVWRTTKRYHLPYVKVGRLVKYRLEDLNTFIESRTISALI